MKKNLIKITASLLIITSVTGCSKTESSNDVPSSVPTEMATVTPTQTITETPTVVPTEQAKPTEQVIQPEQENQGEDVVLYASDSDASDFKGYTELVMKYPKLQDGKSIEFTYDFECPEYQTLLDTYDVKKIAEEGSEFERAVNLMDYFAPRLVHESNYDNHIESNALALLEYSLNNSSQGINCLAKSKILEEMCLALGIYARRVYLLPYTSVSMDSHVVTEIYDTTYDKWIMLDMTTDSYYIDEDGIPLSVLEIREDSATGKMCTTTISCFKGTPKVAASQFTDMNSYIMKNIFTIGYEEYHGFGVKKNTHSYYMVPENFDFHQWVMADQQYRISCATGWGVDQTRIDAMKETLEELKKETDYNKEYQMSADCAKRSPFE